MSELMTNAEFCEEEHVSPPTAQRYRREGTGPAFYRLPGGGVRYRRRDVEAWRAARRVEP
jgi:predicted site-specific integrase-resolvase